MQSKHKIVLSLSQKLGIALDAIQKYVHWYKIDKGINYDFVRGHSFELENDIKTFIAKDHLSKKQYASELDMSDRFAIQGLKNKITQGEDFALPAIVFELKRDKNTLFTIGYEGISVDTYINKLVANHIKNPCGCA